LDAAFDQALGFKEHNFWLTFFTAVKALPDQFMDVGFAGRFPVMEEKMVDYDVDDSDLID
jgi:hypothetical protein